jgi:hypothetical protein
MVFKALKNMGEEANDEAKRQSGALAEFAKAEVSRTASSLKTARWRANCSDGSKSKEVEPHRRDYLRLRFSEVLRWRNH